MNPLACSFATEAEPYDRPSSDLGLPEVSEESIRLMEGRPPPTFAEQIAHARMLLAWRNGRPADHPPRQRERFEM